MRKLLIVLAASIFLAGPASAEVQTIVSHEEEKYFYAGTDMRKYDGQFENTYLLDMSKGTVTRTRYYDFQTKKITADETVYKIQSQLDSDPNNATRFGVPPFLRAVGSPDTNSIEILIIRPDTVISALSTPTELVISRGRRLK
jgi:uncharacterized protein YceK